MNDVRKTIGWAEKTWNPIKGLCQVACPYCYARKMYKRFKRPGKLTLDYKELHTPANYEGPGRIFVCSTMEIFHPDIPKFWRDEIFNIINALSSLTFIILTKMPERIDRPMPPNVILGVSVTERKDFYRIDLLHKQTVGVKMVSFEPILEPDFAVIPNGLLCGLGWVIAGRLTGHGTRNDPARKTIETLVGDARIFDVPVFLKENLRSIWGDNLIQEFPR